MGACHCTSDGKEHKIIWRAGSEQDTIFHLRVTEFREQGNHSWLSPIGLCEATLNYHSFASSNTHTHTHYLGP